jgi:hypothetical protein
VARGKKKVKSKSGLPIEAENEILLMKPEALAIDTTFERNNIDALQEQKKNDDQIAELKAKVKEFDDNLKTLPEVEEAQAALDALKEENTSEDHSEAKENLSALNKGWNDDIKDRKKKLKFMEKTLRAHIKSGALKRA